MDLPRRETVVLDWGVAAVVIAAGVLLGLAAAAVPAIWAARVSLSSLISGMAVRGGASSGRMRRSLIVAQVALSLVLLSAGALVVRSFQQLLAADPGFRPSGALTFGLDLDDSIFPRDADSFAFQDSLETALRSIPGVAGAGAAHRLPMSGGANITQNSIPGAPGNAGGDQDMALVERVYTRPGYVEAMGIRLMAGRVFEEARREGVREVLIDQYLAKQFFPGSNPIGATLLEYHHEDRPMTVVGVIRQARLYNLHKDGRPQIFVRAEDYTNIRPQYYVVRSGLDARALIPDVLATIRRVDRRVPVYAVRTMDEIVAEARSRERISAVMVAGLALGALLLVAMGLFGMVSGSVARRGGELAVRMALGATHHRVIRLVVGESGRLIMLGLLLGIPGIYISGRTLQGFLIGVSPFDLPTLAAAATGLVAISLLACCLAARRITSIEPDRLLREGS
jgi:putative ABC transport system permease protein